MERRSRRCPGRMVDVVPHQKYVLHERTPERASTTRRVAGRHALLKCQSDLPSSSAPWELYHAALHHSILETSKPPSRETHSPQDIQTYLLARSSLLRLHNLYLLFTLLSPVLGACLLAIMRSTLSHGDRECWIFLA